VQKRERKAVHLYQVVFYAGKLCGKLEELEELDLLEIVDDVGCDADVHDESNAAAKRKRIKPEILSTESAFKRTRGPSKQQMQEDARRREELRRAHWLLLRSMRQLVALHGSALLSRKAVVQHTRALTRAPESDAQLWDDIIQQAATEGTIRRVRADGTPLKGGERDVRLVPMFLQACGPGRGVEGLNQTLAQSGQSIDWDRFTGSLDGPEYAMHLVLWPESLGLGGPQSKTPSSKAEETQHAAERPDKRVHSGANEARNAACASNSAQTSDASLEADLKAEPQEAAGAVDMRSHTESNRPVNPPRPAQNEWALFVLQERPLAVQAVMGGSRLNNTPAIGWHRACVSRRDGSKADVYYFAPDGTQLRSRNDVSRWIESQPTVVVIEKEEGPRLASPVPPVQPYISFCCRLVQAKRRSKHPPIGARALFRVSSGSLSLPSFEMQRLE
jgi:hypothetical protein